MNEPKHQRRLGDLTPEEYRKELREGAKEGIQEWADGKVNALGRWTLRAVLVGAIAIVVKGLIALDAYLG